MFAKALQSIRLFTRLAGATDSVEEDALQTAFFDAADDDDRSVRIRKASFPRSTMVSGENGFMEVGTDPILEGDPLENRETNLIERGEAFVQLPIPCTAADKGNNQVTS